MAAKIRLVKRESKSGHATLGFYKGKKAHGELYEWYANGVVLGHAFIIEGMGHGLFVSYTPDGENPIKTFFMEGKIVEIPFLPDKPPAQGGYKSDRTRIDTLEIG